MTRGNKFCLLAVFLTWALAAQADTCPSDIAGFFAGKIAGMVCFHSPDLTTNNTTVIDGTTSPPAGGPE